MNTGLCPRVNRSGATDARGPISKHGPKYLRWALFEAANGSSRDHVMEAPTSSAAVARPQPTTCSFPGRMHKRAMALGTSAVCRCIARESLVLRSAGFAALLNR